MDALFASRYYIIDVYIKHSEETLSSYSSLSHHILFQA